MTSFRRARQQIGAYRVGCWLVVAVKVQHLEAERECRNGVGSRAMFERPATSGIDVKRDIAGRDGERRKWEVKRS